MDEDGSIWLGAFRLSAKKTLSAEQRRALLATPAGWLACGFGSGLMPVAQGTFGSLAALLPWLLLRELPLPIYLLVLLLGFAIGVWACNVAGRALGVDDHRSLVWDEFIGQWIALIPLLLPALLPASGFAWWMLLAGFVLFRLFDVWKPWPISWLDRHLKSGMGVMVDDVVAGVFAAIVLALGLYVL
jgi:phosphatidylglycerophosphatase A